jgi:hypothetical protein
MFEFVSCIRRITSALQAFDLDYVIVGGVAAILLGRSRSTMDIDIIVRNEREKIILFTSALQDMDFNVMQDQILSALDEGFNITIFDKLSSIRLDLKPARSRDEQEVLETAAVQEYHDLSLKIATIEQVLYGKVMYIGPVEDLTDEEIVGNNDVLDFCTLYTQYKESLDIAWLESKTSDLGLSNTFQRLITLADSAGLPP